MLGPPSCNLSSLFFSRVLCETVKDFLAKVAESFKDDDDQGEGGMTNKCAVLNQKLDALLTTLNEESQADPTPASVAEDVTNPGLADRVSGQNDPVTELCRWLLARVLA